MTSTPPTSPSASTAPNGPPPASTVTLEHTSHQGAAVTGSGHTLLEALTRATNAFDTYIRPTLEQTAHNARLDANTKPRRTSPTTAAGQ